MMNLICALRKYGVITTVVATDLNNYVNVSPANWRKNKRIFLS